MLDCVCGEEALCQRVHAVNRHCIRLCMWSTGIVPECACGQQALCQSVHVVNRQCQSVHVVNRHCVRVYMWSTGIVSECACGQQALCQSVHVVNRLPHRAVGRELRHDLLSYLQGGLPA